MKDDIKAAWGEIKEYIKMQLNCVITSWLVVTYDKIMTLKKIITTYLDVTNDCILLGAVVATIDFILFDQLSIPSSIDSTDVNHYANASISHYDCLHPSICCTESSPVEKIVD